MTPKLPNLADTQTVIQAIENNAAELLLAMGRAGDGEEYHEPHIHWIIGGSPIDYHNAVVRTDLTQTNMATDAIIKEVIQQFEKYGVPGSWHVGPSARPLYLGEYLLQHGFRDAGAEPGMAADLAALDETVSSPPGLIIEQLQDEEKLYAWAAALAQDFGEGEREANWVRDIYRTIGFGEGVPFRHYLGWLDGEPVATATLFLGAGVAGIYFVTTIPQARRQGIGAAITLSALRDARSLGYRVGVLGSSQPGYPLYQRIGFQEYCQIGIYEWESTP